MASLQVLHVDGQRLARGGAARLKTFPGKYPTGSSRRLQGGHVQVCTNIRRCWATPKECRVSQKEENHFTPIHWDGSSLEWRRIICSPYCDLPPGQKHVLITLALYGDKWGDNIFPSQREVGYRAGVSPKSVNANMQKAEKEGWLLRKTMGRQWGRGYKQHCYELTIPFEVAELQANKRRFWNPPYEFKLVKKGKQVVKVQRYLDEKK